MRKCVTAHAIIAVLLAFYVTGVSAQIRFAGNKKGLSVNGKIVDSRNLHESLLNVVEILSVSDEGLCSVYTPELFRCGQT